MRLFDEQRFHRGAVRKEMAERLRSPARRQVERGIKSPSISRRDWWSDWFGGQLAHMQPELDAFERGHSKHTHHLFQLVNHFARVVELLGRFRIALDVVGK